jgi:hypothetical protein
MSNSDSDRPNPTLQVRRFAPQASHFFAHLRPLTFGRLRLRELRAKSATWKISREGREEAKEREEVEDRGRLAN